MNSITRAAQLIAEAGRAWYEQWIETVSRFVILEIGAGTALPSIRRIGQSLGAPLIRINPQCDSGCSETRINLGYRALDGLRGIRKELEAIGWMPSA